MEYTTIIVAAGSGSRTGLSYNKVLHKINDKTIIEMSVSHFLQDEECVEIIVVIQPNEKEEFQKVLPKERVRYIEGGKTRSESVFNGLLEVETPYVMIHDGARPYLEKKTLEDVKTCLQLHNACIVAVPVVDTIKYVENGFVKQTPLRDNCFAAQTPQAFQTMKLKEAYKKAIRSNELLSDDAMVMEQFGDCKVAIVEGKYTNKKITNTSDL